MGNRSEYYKNLRKKNNQKLHELQLQLPAYAIAYLRDKERTSQINTVVGYAYDLLTFFTYLKETNPLYIEFETKDVPGDALNQLSFKDINEYQDYLEGKIEGTQHNNGHSGISRRMAALRGMFDYCCTHGYLYNNPTVGASKQPKPKRNAIVRMDVDEANYLLSVVEDTKLSSSKQRKFCQKTQLRDTAIIVLLLGTGIRVSECVGLDINDINFKKNSMEIVRKGGDSQMIYLNDEVTAYLMDYIENERPLFMDETIERKALFLSSKKRRMCVKSVENVVKKYAAVAVPNKHITAHRCRSTYGTTLYKATSDIYMVANNLGHRDINTTSTRYSAIDEEYSRRAAEIDLYGRWIKYN